MSSEKKTKEVFCVEQGVPLPKLYAEMRYPFRKMSVGDSFAVPPNELVKLRNKIWRNAAPDGMKFALRQLIRGDASSYRCWRTK